IPQETVPPPERYSDNVDAVLDILLPKEPERPGAREVFADRFLRLEAFVPWAVASGLLPRLSDAAMATAANFDAAFRTVINRELDRRAGLERPLTSFRDLSRPVRETIVAQMFDDSWGRAPLLVLRAACFFGYLGAVYSDAGLIAVGFPPFENFADGLAVS